MRSSKSRSRSKSNRNRSVGNIVNRVFDSSGPEGKVRGTPQQIIEKYNQLARDAQLSNDRVSTENFQQHSEHYTRMLGEAQREADARREQQDAQNRERQRERDEARGQPQQDPAQGMSGGAAGDAQPQTNAPTPPAAQPQVEAADPMPMENVDGLGEVVDLEPGSDSGLVETPESKPRRPRRPRKPRAATSEAPVSEAPAGAAKTADKASHGTPQGAPADDAAASDAKSAPAARPDETAASAEPPSEASSRAEGEQSNPGGTPGPDDPIRPEAAE